MAASTYTILLDNGMSLSVYQAASQAVNTNPVCTTIGAAGSTTTTTDFSFPSDCHIRDVVVTSALTAGAVEIYNVSKGLRTQKGIGSLETYLNTNTTRNPPRIGFRGGQVYRLIQTVAGNA